MVENNALLLDVVRYMDCDVRKVSSNLTSNYSLNLVTDISLNGTIIRCCNVRNGLKQGDAFSCIIFIMAMDPLLKKRGANARIRPERSHNYTWPKTYGYDNDIMEKFPTFVHN